MFLREGVGRMSEVTDILGAHVPAEDWHCSCGEDLFGGSAAYAYELYKSHVAGLLKEWIRERVREDCAAAWEQGWDAAGAESAIFCSRSGGCISPARRDEDNPYRSMLSPQRQASGE